MSYGNEAEAEGYARTYATAPRVPTPEGVEHDSAPFALLAALNDRIALAAEKFGLLAAMLAPYSRNPEPTGTVVAPVPNADSAFEGRILEVIASVEHLIGTIDDQRDRIRL